MSDIYSAKKRSEVMSRIRSGDTKPELIVRRLLHRHGFRFRLHSKLLPGKPDIILPRYRTAVFVHGCFWHGHNCHKGKAPSSRQEFWLPKLRRNIERDEQNKEALSQLGWRVIVVWECETKQPEELIKGIEKELRA